MACGTQKAEIVDHRGVVVATLLEQRRRRHRSFIFHHAALTAVLLIVALWAAPGAASASVLADAPVTTATVLAAKAVPGVQLVQTDYSATVSVPEPVINQKAVDALGEPMLTSSLLLPDEEEPMTDGWQIKEALDHQVDAVIDSGECGTEPTTVVDYSDGSAQILRHGAGDPSLFE